MSERIICVIGGGAAGFFAAIEAARKNKNKQTHAKIILLEATTRFLQKVRISGGGRCNVTHHDFDIRSFSTRYPRGQKEVLSPMHQFQAADLVDWFENLGVRLKVEEDGRMFPVTDDSETIIGCLTSQAQSLGVRLDKEFSVKTVIKQQDKFVVTSQKGQTLKVDRVLLATGSSPDGYNMATALGHKITPRAPSLFSFKISSKLLQDMQGTSFPHAHVELVVGSSGTYKEQAPVLITHWGVSGPAVLKISAWAAREMKDHGYKAKLAVNWVGKSASEVESYFKAQKKSHPNMHMGNLFVENISKKFWRQVLTTEGIALDMYLAQVSKKNLQRLVAALTQTVLQVVGKNRFKDEFVECGGVSLKEIDMKTMQSKLVPGLFFAGEIMDVDGVTGGFNLQHAWTSGWVAGHHIVVEW